MTQQQYKSEGKPGTEDLAEEYFYEERHRTYPPESSFHMPPPYPPYMQQAPKKKWLSMLLSFLVPGTGQFYLGAMHRGLFIMLLIVTDIFGIVLFASREGAPNVPMITLFSLILPVIYCYNVFESLQLTDAVNRSRYYGDPDMYNDSVHKLSKNSSFGFLLIAAGVFLFLASSKPAWLESLFQLFASYFGAGILILAGLALYIWESKRK
ncbi:hypothetical protein [Paenibacillus sp. FJAT-26967]|uniref:hypothetical protein n=1 Tax=Paenibacillus sp. FJAT-26967 TaxID=1729690 RepID=UPI00083837C0|nr:hypothetical protein [Paenibacillus sp. FJAT-26967]